MGKSRIRAYQDWVDNRGWRIQRVYPGDPNRIRYHVGSVWALLGAGAFVLGLYLELTQPLSPPMLPHGGLMLALGGLVFTLLSIGFSARAKRKGWVLVRAGLVDRELRLATVRNGRAWCWRLLCRYELNGCAHEVTPGINQISRIVRGARRIEKGRERAIEFLERCLIGEDEVALYVNPDRPLETELVRGDYQDWFLYGRGRYHSFAAANALKPGRHKLSTQPLESPK
jgi:hypothetical protein